MSRYCSRLAVLAFFISGCTDPAPERTPRPLFKDHDLLSKQKQEVMRKIREGYLSFVKYEDYATAKIGPKWNEMSREDQIDLLDLVIADCYLVPKGSVILSNEKVLIFDGETQIGQYGIFGLEMN